MKKTGLLLCCAFAFAAMLRAETEATRPMRSADAILNQYCNVCHATGWNGAPVSGDAAEWKLRLRDGLDAMVRNAQQGLNNMPPMGTCQDCSEAELRAAIEAMIATN